MSQTTALSKSNSSSKNSINSINLRKCHSDTSINKDHKDHSNATRQPSRKFKNQLSIENVRRSYSSDQNVSTNFLFFSTRVPYPTFRMKYKYQVFQMKQ